MPSPGTTMRTLPSLRGCFFLAAALASTAAAHSHIEYVLVNGAAYAGWIPRPEYNNPPDAVGWSTSANDDGYVSPADYASPDIICHRDATPARAHIPVAPGDRIHFQWNGWPQSHEGPVLTYLAPCGEDNVWNTSAAAGAGGCAAVDKTKLEFFKIDDSAPGLLPAAGGGGGGGGQWATDTLVANNNSWLVEVPPGLAAGPYVLRHEVIALQDANRTDGAQNYPQCFNLWVGEASSSSSSSAGGTPPGAGVPATELYRADDPGIVLDIYAAGLTSYDIPGPALAPNAVPIPVSDQKNMQWESTGTPVLVKGNATEPFPALASKPAEVRN